MEVVSRDGGGKRQARPLRPRARRIRSAISRGQRCNHLGPSIGPPVRREQSASTAAPPQAGLRPTRHPLEREHEARQQHQREKNTAPCIACTWRSANCREESRLRFARRCVGRHDNRTRRLMLTLLGGLAEFERDPIRARTGEGREPRLPPALLLKTDFISRRMCIKKGSGPR